MIDIQLWDLIKLEQEPTLFKVVGIHNDTYWIKGCNMWGEIEHDYHGHLHRGSSKFQLIARLTDTLSYGKMTKNYVGVSENA